MPPSEQACRGDAADNTPETILLADDEKALRELARAILQRSGYQVLLAADGVEALEAYRRHDGPIDLVILDLTMPRLSGRETFRELRRLAPGVRVMFASGYSVEEVQEEQDQTCGFVAKPYRPDGLTAAVRAALDRARGPVGARGA
jgi:DNA-binding response OmpR family regulator